MALRILNQGATPESVASRIQDAIAAAIEDAEIEVRPRGPGHFEISVVSPLFAGKSRVAQHQLVYAAITELMSGSQPPVHAIDRLECRTP
jgi:stress-induced morphogen